MAEPGFIWPKAGTPASHSPVWLPRARAKSLKGGQKPVLEVLKECSFHLREGWQSSRRGARRGDPSWQDKGWIPGDGGEYGPVGEVSVHREAWASRAPGTEAHTCFVHPRDHPPCLGRYQSWTVSLPQWRATDTGSAPPLPTSCDPNPVELVRGSISDWNPSCGLARFWWLLPPPGTQTMASLQVFWLSMPCPGPDSMVFLWFRALAPCPGPHPHYVLLLPAKAQRRKEWECLPQNC